MKQANKQNYKSLSEPSQRTKRTGDKDRHDQTTKKKVYSTYPVRNYVPNYDTI